MIFGLNGSLSARVKLLIACAINSDEEAGDVVDKHEKGRGYDLANGLCEIEPEELDAVRAFFPGSVAKGSSGVLSKVVIN